jgi:hypothetical protein
MDKERYEFMTLRRVPGRLAEGLKTTLLGQISHSVLGRLKNFGDIGLRQSAI